MKLVLINTKQHTMLLVLVVCSLFASAGCITTLQVVWLTPFVTPDHSNYQFNASTTIGALALGIERVKQYFLPNHEINVTVLDSECSSKKSVGKLVDHLFRQRVDAVIGPPCPRVVPPVGELLAYRNIPMLNWVSMGQTFDDYKNDLTTYIRLMSPVSSLGGLMVQFYYQYKWKRLIMISTQGDAYEAGAAMIEQSLLQHNQNNYTIVHHYSMVGRNASDDVIDDMFSSIKHEGRIVILVIPKEDLRQYMIRAYDLGMAGGDYQFLYTASELEDHKDSELLHSDRLWRANDENDFKARQGFENVLYFVLGHSTEPTYTWRNESFDAYDRVFSGRTDVPKPVEPDEYAPYLHDTMVLYGSAVNMSISANFSAGGLDLFRFSTYIKFKGFSGDVVMNLRADRQPSFFVYDLDTDGTFTQVVTVRWTIDPNTNAARMNVSVNSIVWGDGRTSDDYNPPDVPLCGFFDENCPDTGPEHQSYEVVIGTVSAAMLIVLLILFLIYRWYRGEQGLKKVWKINYEDLKFGINKKRKSISGQLSSHSLPSTGTISCGSMRGTIVSESSTRPVLTRGQIFTTVALYKGEIVAVKWSNRKRISTDRSFAIEMRNMVELKHTNLTSFLGVCTTPEKICSVWEYCNKGSLQDVIGNDDIRLDTMFKLSFAIDICQGLEYIHKSSIKHHGKLQSSNCVIDSRWVCKLTDFGLRRLSSLLDDTEDELGEHAYYARLFWTAPEILRSVLKRESYSGTQAGDIYAFGIILKEILCRNEPYSDEQKTPKEIIHEIANPESADFPFRPVIEQHEVEAENHRMNLEYLIRRCWTEDAEDRPTSKAVLRSMNKINPYKKASVVDNMIVMMEKYTNNLEEIVADRTEQLREEKRKTDQLLYRMLPKKVADDLKFGRSVQAEAFDSVTIYFSDIVQFTDLAGESTPLQIVELLNALYIMFDDIISHYDVYKVETIGDAYMIVSGLPERNGNLHVREISYVALSILQHVLTFKIPHKPEKQLEIRIGLHTGPVVAGVVGLTMPRYCLFGDTVNTASRMESNGKPLKIHISPSTKTALDGFPKFYTEERGEIQIKGKGVMRTYWLTGLNEAIEETPDQQQEFKKLIEPDNKHREESNGGRHVTSFHGDHQLKVMSESEGKVSVADSGIAMDRAHDDDKTTLYKTDLDDIDTDSDDSSSSDGLIFIKEGSAPGHIINFVGLQPKAKSFRSNSEMINGRKDSHTSLLPVRHGVRVHPAYEGLAATNSPVCKNKSTLFMSNSFRSTTKQTSDEPPKQRYSFSFGEKLLRRKKEHISKHVKSDTNKKPTRKKSKRSRISKGDKNDEDKLKHKKNQPNVKVTEFPNVGLESSQIVIDSTNVNIQPVPVLAELPNEDTQSNQFKTDLSNVNDQPSQTMTEITSDNMRPSPLMTELTNTESVLCELKTDLPNVNDQPSQTMTEITSDNMGPSPLKTELTNTESVSCELKTDLPNVNNQRNPSLTELLSDNMLPSPLMTNLKDVDTSEFKTDFSDMNNQSLLMAHSSNVDTESSQSSSAVSASLTTRSPTLSRTEEEPEQYLGDMDCSAEHSFDVRTRTSIFTIPHRVSATDYMSPKSHWYDTKM